MSRAGSTSDASAVKNESSPLTSGQNRAIELLGGLLGQPTRIERFRDNVRAYVPAARIFEALRALRDECGMQLIELGGTDYLGYPEREHGRDRFEVHYVILNLETGDRLIVKAGVSDPDPTLASVVPLWPGADWQEREVFDMFGIRFEGHPDLRRILMPEEFVAFPLRKDYPLRGRGERHNFPKITRDQS